MVHPVSAALIVLVVAHASTAAAQSWRLTEARLTPQVRSWGPDCGPRPQVERPRLPGTWRDAAGGALQAEGGAPRLFDERACLEWTQQRDLRVQRTGAGYVCNSPPGAAKTVLVSLSRESTGPGQTRIEHQTHYTWTLKGSDCNVVLHARFDLEDPAARAAAAPSAPPSVGSAAPEPTSPPCRPTGDGATPGALARLVPAGSGRRAVPVDGRVGLAVRGLDAAGCPIAALPALEWSTSAGRIDAHGVLDLAGVPAGTSAAVIARSSGLEARFTIQIAQSAADYTALTVADPMLSEGALPSLPPHRATGVAGAAESADDADQILRSRLLVGAFVGLLCVAAGVGLWLAVRAVRRRRTAPPEVLDAQALDVLERSSARASRRAAGQAGRVCPVCGRVYPAGAEFCGEDGARLQQAAN